MAQAHAALGDETARRADDLDRLGAGVARCLLALDEAEADASAAFGALTRRAEP